MASRCALVIPSGCIISIAMIASSGYNCTILENLQVASCERWYISPVMGPRGRTPHSYEWMQLYSLGKLQERGGRFHLSWGHKAAHH